jgi:hypothetical protein
VKSWKYYNHQVRKVYTTFVFHVRALDICRTITSLTVFYPNPLCQLSLWGKPEKKATTFGRALTDSFSREWTTRESNPRTQRWKALVLTSSEAQRSSSLLLV